MNKLIAIVLGILLFISCSDKAEKEQIPKKEIVQKGNIPEKEPNKPEATELWKPKPAVVIPASKNTAPSDAITLFDGKGMDTWENAKDGTPVKWVLNKDGSITVNPRTGSIQTKKKFGSVQLHLEWRSPKEISGKGQNRGNSGVFLQKRYEVQVLDNNDNETYVNGQVGSIYKQSIPLVNPSAPTGKWNSYDIIFHAPEYDPEGKKIKSGTITVLQNGILIQDHYELKGTTEYIGWPKNIAHGNDALLLQDHGSKVSYRNIWIREL